MADRRPCPFHGRAPCRGSVGLGGDGRQRGAWHQPRAVVRRQLRGLLPVSAVAVAAGRKLDASESQIICRVGFGPTGHGGFGLTVALDLHAPFLTREQGADLMARAHERCPYSNATRGNIVVALSVDGVPLAAAAKVPS